MFVNRSLLRSPVSELDNKTTDVGASTGCLSTVKTKDADAKLILPSASAAIALSR